MCPCDDDDFEEILGCNLIESLPSPSPKLPCPYPDSTSFSATAHQQRLQSRLFQLPAEIRQTIFLELWRSAGLAQHIFLQDGRYAHAPCIIERDVDESKGYFESLGLKESWSVQLDDGANKRRLLSSWCNHWPCEEVVLRAQQHPGFELLPSDNRASKMTSGLFSAPNPFIASLLTCKQMYLECSASIYSSVTFSFTRATTAYDFLVTRALPMGHRSAVQHIRNIDLSCRLNLKPPEEYYGRGELLRTWDSLVRALPTLPSISSVCCWLDTPGLSDNMQLASDSRPFLSVNAKLARILTADFPVDEVHGIQWEVWPQEEFRKRPRTCERYDPVIPFLFD